VNTSSSALWQAPLPDAIKEELHELSADIAKQPGRTTVFFRADDVGKIDAGFIPLMELFDDHKIPLCPALVPCWLSADSWAKICSITGRQENFCWHQHGYAHADHAVSGKKNEFGDNRTEEEIRAEITGGKEILEQMLGDTFFPAFTPPWNRCSSTTLEILQELQFQVLSRSINVSPQPPDRLVEFPVNIDLHTRREKSPEEGMKNLLEECRQAAKTGLMGFMIHHQRMNDNAFLFLELLFQAMRNVPQLEFCTFRELLNKTRHDQTLRSGS
jgi:predicted deacetylase